MLEKKAFEPAKTRWATLIVSVQKKGDSLGFCVDFPRAKYSDRTQPLSPTQNGRVHRLTRGRTNILNPGR